MHIPEHLIIQGDIRGFEHFMASSNDRLLPSVSIDTVIFSIIESKLNVLVLKISGTDYQMIPGGYVAKDEELDDAAYRILNERTGISNLFLEQFYTSGRVNRATDIRLKEILENSGYVMPEGNWFEQRFISVCYYALIDSSMVKPNSPSGFFEYRWLDPDSLPVLFFDHNMLINRAVERLRIDMDQKLVGFNLLNETFTMNELQSVYEAVFQNKFSRANFQRKMLSLDILERLDKLYTGGSHKAPYLYRFKQSQVGF
ncbi:MAG TPA: NUDIX hydrolase [Prolixibacteraceae bacterium]|nr:NUDIX hydrolase [Prolixibacteraceae bacterium]